MLTNLLTVLELYHRLFDSEIQGYITEHILSCTSALIVEDTSQVSFQWNEISIEMYK